MIIIPWTACTTTFPHNDMASADTIRPYHLSQRRSSTRDKTHVSPEAAQFKGTVRGVQHDPAGSRNSIGRYLYCRNWRRSDCRD